METFYASHEIGLSEDAEAERRSAEDIARVSKLVGRLRKVWQQTSHPLLSERLAQCMDELATAVVLASRDTGEWEPTCNCNAGDPVPCVVLDPFAGAGTVSLVAERLGRDSIGIELNPSYVSMATERIRRDCPMFAAVEVTG